MQRIGFVLSPGFQVMSFAALSVFECANKEMGEPVYYLHLLSETGGLMRSSIGVSVATEPFDDTTFDTLFFSRGTEPSTPGLIEFLRQAPERCRRVAATRAREQWPEQRAADLTHGPQFSEISARAKVSSATIS